MKRYFAVIIILLALIESSCNKMDSTYRDFLKDGPITYTEKVDSVRAYAGRERMLLTWNPITDPRVTKVVISWSSGSGSIEVPIASEKDTLTLIEGLEEGNYVFDLYTYDAADNRSVKAEVVGRVHGDVYESGLILRSVSQMTLTGNTLRIRFRPMEGVEGYDSEEVTYISSVDGQEKTILRKAGIDPELIIEDFSGEEFTHRSIYKPQVLSPDLFYSVSATVNIFADPAELEYTNPVFTPILADPSVIRDPLTGYFYAYGTEDRWPNGTNQIVPIVRSQDLVNWSYVGNAFSTKPAWKSSGGVWAPDIAYVNGKYHLYYSMSVWGDEDPGIGVAVADYPAGPFSDYGKMFLSSEIDVPNSIDPFYYEDGGKKYLFWGSFDNTPKQGTYAVELSENGRSVKDMSQKFKIAAGDWEAVNIFQKNGYYYFFGSKGGCCDGASSTYRVLVARSTNLLGPYLDRNGNNIANRGNGTLVLQRNAQYAGPGHNAPIMTDNNGDDWMLYHAIDVNNPMVNNVNQRVLMLDKIHWDAQGWPLVNNGSPSFENMLKPVF